MEGRISKAGAAKIAATSGASFGTGTSIRARRPLRAGHGVAALAIAIWCGRESGARAPEKAPVTALIIAERMRRKFIGVRHSIATREGPCLDRVRVEKARFRH